MKKANLIAAAAFAVFAGIVLWQSSLLPAGRGRVPGPAVFPTAVAVIMLMASLALVITTFRMLPSENKKLDLLKKDNVRVYICMAVLIVYFFVVQLIGFCVTSSLLLFCLIYWFGRYKFWICALSSLAIVGTLWYVFSEVLHVPLRFGLLM